MKWKTKTGEVIDIKDMDDNHLQNCINLLARRLKEQPANQVYMGNSEYAEDAVEQENRHNEDMAERIINFIEVMEREQEFRKGRHCEKCREEMPVVICKCEVNKFNPLNESI